MFEHRKPQFAPRDPLKTCLKCDAAKDVYTEFYWVHGVGVGWPQGMCKTCFNERQTEYRKKHAAKYAKLALEWRQKNPEKAKRISQKSNATTGKVRKKRYMQSPKGRVKYAFYGKLRRAHRLNATTPESRLVTHEWFRDQCVRQDHKCVYCHEVKRLTLDHVTPISRGGKHVCENIVGACPNCNSAKHDKTLLEWKPEFCLGVYDGRFSEVTNHV